MNQQRLSAISAAIAALLMLSACGAAPADPPLADARIGGPFALTGADGRVVRDSDFAGRYRIMYFGYTSCPDVCPTDLANIALAMKKLGAADPALAKRIVPIFVSVDPERDTPALVGKFTAAFSPDIVGLTGKPAQIAALAKEYAVAYQAEPRNAEGGYLVSHSSQAYLMSPDNKPMALLPTDQSGDAVLAELKRWAR